MFRVSAKVEPLGPRPFSKRPFSAWHGGALLDAYWPTGTSPLPKTKKLNPPLSKHLNP